VTRTIVRLLLGLSTCLTLPAVAVLLVAAVVATPWGLVATLSMVAVTVLYFGLGMGAGIHLCAIAIHELRTVPQEEPWVEEIYSFLKSHASA
jgi:hypothetical protein